jgi:hypothetical protein
MIFKLKFINKRTKLINYSLVIVYIIDIRLADHFFIFLIKESMFWYLVE